jgi:plastocyanin
MESVSVRVVGGSLAPIVDPTLAQVGGVAGMALSRCAADRRAACFASLCSDSGMFDRHPRPLRRLASAFVGALLLLAAVSPVALAQGDTVVITSTIEPATLEVTPGTAVTWRNDDAERHRIRSREGPEEFDSGNLEPGESFTFTFSLEGTYPYVDERDDENAAYFGTIVVTSTPEGEAAAGELPTTGAVTIGDRVFIPPTLEVATGATVEWTNADSETHTVTASEGAFDSGILAEGAAFSATLDAPGSYAYLCAIHPEMTGTITVSDPAPGGSPALGAPASAETSPAPIDAATLSPAASFSPSPSASPSGSPDASPSDSPSGSPDASASAPASPAAADSAGATVSMFDRAFDPTTVEVPVGGSVDWTNDDTEGHTVTATDGSFDSGVVGPGAAYSEPFETAGTFDYFCAIHPEMLASVVVTETAAPGAASPSASGSPGAGVEGQRL